MSKGMMLPVKYKFYWLFPAKGTSYDEENTCLKLSFLEDKWFVLFVLFCIFFFFLISSGLPGSSVLLLCKNTVGQVSISSPVCYCFILVSSKFMSSSSLCWLLANCKIEFYYFIHCIKDLGSILGSGRSPGEGNGNSLQYSCLVNPTDGGTW